MSDAKRQAISRLPIRRGLSESEAALYIGIGSTNFRALVEKGIMPRPRVLGGRRLWDVDDLDAAFRSLPVAGSDNKIDIADDNPWH